MRTGILVCFISELIHLNNLEQWLACSKFSKNICWTNHFTYSPIFGIVKLFNFCQSNGCDHVTVWFWLVFPIITSKVKQCFMCYWPLRFPQLWIAYLYTLGQFFNEVFFFSNWVIGYTLDCNYLQVIFTEKVLSVLSFYFF